MATSQQQQLVGRQLVRPTSHIPWSADVHHVAPKKIIGEILPSNVTASASGFGWAAATNGNGYVYVWQPKIIPLSDTLEGPAHCMKVFFNDLLLLDDDDDNDNDEGQDSGLPSSTARDQTILLGICPSNNSGSGGNGGDTSTVDSINLYGYHKGWLVLRKLTTKDLQQSRSGIGSLKSNYPKVKIPLEMDEEGLDELVTSLTAAPNVLVLGTNLGNLSWVTLTPVPVGLHVQKVVPETGWLTRVVFGSSTHTGGTESSSIVLPLSSTEFLSLSQDGGALTHWKVTVTVGTSHHATFEPVLKGSLAINRVELTKPTVLRATLAADQQSMHCIVRGTLPDGDTRIHWIQANLDGTVIRSHWLARFAEPENVQAHGVVAAKNRTSYAAFYQPSIGLVIVMALLPGDDIIQEVDLPTAQVEGLVPNMLEADTTTHGCSVLAIGGIGLRIRHIPQEGHSPSANKRARHLSPSSGKGKGNNASLIQTLVSHLRSSFWQAYQDPESHRPLPPSLRSADPQDLELAIVAFATELQHRGDAVSATNPMEWHRALVRFLQERGLYRSVSQGGRWQLLSIGQELDVFGYIVNHHHTLSMSYGICQSHNVAGWLAQAQEGPTGVEEWNSLLGGLLEMAMTYREAKASTFYDVMSDTPTQPVWLSHKSLQTVLLQQLELWRRSPSLVERFHAETLVKAALQSYSESYPHKDVYDRVQSLAIRLLRSMTSEADDDIIGVDELAFDLCIQFNYFQGLCQISVDHEKKRDAATYSLDPLFATIQGRDPLSGYSFAQFVLQWHTDKGLYGHAINYGRHSPTDWQLIMEKDERLRQYKWIPAIRQSYFEQATQACLANCQMDKTLASNQWTLSMAKLANKLIVTQNKSRTRAIDRQLDLVNAQQMLEVGEGDAETMTAGANIPLRSSEELIRIALQRLQEAVTIDDRVHFATIALAICAAIQDNTASINHTAHVWALSFRLDDDQWAEWLRTESDLTGSNLRDRILSSTVFGALLQECRKESSMSLVTYGRHIESAVLDKIGGDASKLELSRLLRSATSTPGSAMQGQSLVVASY